MIKIRKKFLSRERRENSNKYFGIEEFKEGDLIRECYEESCTMSEMMEAIESVPMLSIFKQYQSDPCRNFNMCSVMYSLLYCITHRYYSFSAEHRNVRIKTMERLEFPSSNVLVIRAMAASFVMSIVIPKDLKRVRMIPDYLSLLD